MACSHIPHIRTKIPLLDRKMCIVVALETIVASSSTFCQFAVA